MAKYNSAFSSMRPGQFNELCKRLQGKKEPKEIKNTIQNEVASGLEHAFTLKKGTRFS